MTGACRLWQQLLALLEPPAEHLARGRVAQAAARTAHPSIRRRSPIPRPRRGDHR